MNMTERNEFLKYWSLGYTRLVPIIPPDANISERSSLHRAIGTKADPRGKAVGIKRHDGLWGGFDWIPYEADEEDIKRWHRMGAGIGIKTGNGLLAIDADTKDADCARIIRDIAEKHFGRTPIRVGNYPKALYLIRCQEPYRYTRVEFGERNDKGRLLDRVEILSDGRQFVAHGIHPNTKQPYHWPRDIVPIDELKSFTADQIDAFMQELKQALPQAAELVREGATTEISQQSLKGDLEAVRKAVQATPNTTENFPSREAYRDYGYAIKAALPDAPNEAFAIYEDWCAQWIGPEKETNDPATVKSDWNRMKPPYRRGANYIYELAERYSDGKFTLADVWFEQIPEDTQNPFADMNSGQPAPKKKFNFLSFDEAADTALDKSNKPLIKGLLDQGTTSVIYGDSNVGKTFVTMDLAYHIAAGISYAGLRTTQGLVVYVAAEGGNGARRRVAAIREKYGRDRHANFLLLPSPVDFRRADADLGPFLEAIRALPEPPAMIVIDTLSRAMAGGDENSSVDMGALVKHFDLVRVATGAHLAIVHHTGKNKANGARGHSLLRAAVDTEIEIEEGQIAVTKQRDLERSWQSCFALDVVTLGMDPDGDRITSCTVRLVSASEAKQAAAASAVSVPPTPAEQKVLDVIEEMHDALAGAGQGFSLAQIEAAMPGGVYAGGQTTLRSHLRNLAEKGHVVRPKRGFWAQKAVEDASTALESAHVLTEISVENGRKTVDNIFE